MNQPLGKVVRDIRKPPRPAHAASIASAGQPITAA